MHILLYGFCILLGLYALGMLYVFLTYTTPEAHVGVSTVSLHLGKEVIDIVFRDIVHELDDFYVETARAQASKFINSGSHFVKMPDGSFLNKNHIGKITVVHSEEGK